ncbi:hypothetical protein DICVIV_05018 [Dictyocaulus viviparus]|uniref:Uncharacterized protein n=1 Tax=Dictyocaulus viviparus TaxID=29172 RepID=A0A0D8XW22_DICVI|nr:hypothetical protein DICVIV_05018 [Dictyocaulus viviparus]
MFRDADETPRFIRVEIILNSAVFCVTFTDAEYYPSPIRIENHSDVYENKSHVYDPTIPGIGPQLVYENHVYLQLAASFNNSTTIRHTDECELVLETMQKGKVMLNKQNKIDANGNVEFSHIHCSNANQLWIICKDGCIENVGMSYRSRVRVDGHLLCQGFSDMAVTYHTPNIILSKRKDSNDEDISSQIWRIQRQRPGSGTLDVECLHSGPTLVVRITDRENSTQSLSSTISEAVTSVALDINVTMKSGIGISLINGSHEELIYARFGGIMIAAQHLEDTYQLTASVDVIQIDNQLLNSDTWQVLSCQPELFGSDDEGNASWSNGSLPPVTHGKARPALKLEMNCTPKKHYDAFDCFRLKLCDLDVHLDELLLWKLVQFVQASDAASSVQEKTLSMPPNIDLERPDPFRSRRWYFGTLDLEMGHIALSVVTVSKSALPLKCRQLKQQFNVKLISFEKAAVCLPPFRQFHYFETSSFLLESLQKFYFAELQKQTLNIIVTLDAFGNPQGLVTDLKDSFQGLFIEGDLHRFVAGLGYGVSNSISKLASSAASGVGALTFDQEHEAKRRHNIVRSHSTTSTPLSHLYSGVKGLGVGVLGGMTAIFTNTIAESRKSGIVAV